MIDIHCHILPNIDDGPRSLDESIRMAALAAKDGIRGIVATPHTLNGVYTTAVDTVARGVASLRQALPSGNGAGIALYPGSDVHLCTGMAERAGRREFCTINDQGKYFLLELPSQSVPAAVRGEIFAMKLRGITPVITHPERNAAIQHDPGLLAELIGLGALSQVTAMSVEGAFGEFIGEVCGVLLRHRLAHVIASDAHSAGDRPPILSRAVDRAGDILGNYDEAEAMVTSVPAAIVAGRPVDVPDPVPLKRSAGF
jgi:protein-tyrosine phosphatase